MLFNYLIFFAFVLLLQDYFADNIMAAGQGATSKNVLYIVCIIAVAKYLHYLRHPKNVTVMFSTGILISFYVYVYYKSSVDLHDFQNIKEMFIGTTGGTILFFFLGSTTNLLTHGILLRTRTLFQYNLISTAIILLQLIFLITLIYITQSFFGNLSGKRLIVDGLNGAYQRVGNYLTISFILSATCCAIMCLLSINSTSTRRPIGKYVSVMLFLCTAIISLLLSQLLMSNSSLVCIAFISITTAIFLIVTSYNPRLFQNIKSLRTLFFGKPTLYLVKIGVLVVLLIIVIVLFVFDALSIDFSLFRITGYGTGASSSVSSRLELMNNFALHHNVAPIFGNMNVDDETTGPGTYVHGFLPSIITHTGLFGFFIFLCYLFTSTRELFQTIRRSFIISIVQNSFRIFTFTIFSFLFILANFTSFFTWIPLWFAMGLAFPMTYAKGQ